MKNIYLYLVLGLAAIVSAQPNASISTTSINLSTNATAFIAGETIYYKMFLPTVKGKADDKIGYVVLVGQDKSAVFIHKHFLSSGMTYGDFFIPSSIETGPYKIIAYTMESAKLSTQISVIDLVIINPFQTSKRNQDASELVLASEEKQMSTHYNLTQKQQYKTRELVTINSENLPNGKYSVSVRKTDQLDRAKSIADNAGVINQSSIGTIILAPEIRGEIISGKVTSKTLSASKVNLALSIPGENAVYKVVKTDNEGRFIFTVEQMNPSTQIYIQVIGKEQQDFSIVVDKAPMPNFSTLNFQPFRVPEILESDLRERMVAVQIRNSYLGKKADTIVPPSLSRMFYEPISKDYVLDKYTRFPTFAQNIVELMPEVYYLKKDNKYTVHVRDNNIGRTIPEPSLILIDGIMLQDASELFAFPMKNVEKISVVTGIYLYGPTAFNGLVSLTTKNKNYEPKDLKPILEDIIRPFPEKKYYRQQHNDATNRLPDFRQQLLWKPEANKNDTISFYTSDLSGTFKVEITGVTDAGQPFAVTTDFKVVE